MQLCRGIFTRYQCTVIMGLMSPARFEEIRHPVTSSGSLFGLRRLWKDVGMLNEAQQAATAETKSRRCRSDWWDGGLGNMGLVQLGGSGGIWLPGREWLEGG